MQALRDPAGQSSKLPRSFSRIFAGAVIFAVTALALAIAAKWAGSRVVDGGHTTSTKLRTIIVSGSMVVVPDNMIRRANARRDGTRERLDLYMVWPELSGYTEADRDAFNHLEDEHRLIMVSLEPRMISRDMSARYDLVYRQLLNPTPLAAPAGLSAYRFEDGSGFANEVLYVGVRSGEAPFVARCLEEAAAPDAVTPCERDIHLEGDLSLFYRFPRHLLPNWKELDSSVQLRVQSLLRASN